MNKKILLVLMAAMLFLPKINFGQAPSLGHASGFALFSSAGAFTSNGSTTVTGDIGNYTGAVNSTPSTLNGNKHFGDSTAFYAAADISTAYAYLKAKTCDSVLGVGLGNGQTLTARVFCIGKAATLNGDLILDAKGNSNAIFIIKIDGALATGNASNVILKNGASGCNVYWQINGAFTLGDSSVFRGTIVNDGAITLLSTANLYGRGLTTAGAITLNANNVAVGSSPVTKISSAGSITSVCAGKSITLTAKMTSGTGPFTYLWSPGSQTDSVITVTPGTKTTYKVSVISSNGCSPATDSFVVSINSGTPINVTSNPTATTVCAGTAAVFSVTATGTGLFYQWRKGSVNISNSGSYSGATTATLTITPAAAIDAATNYNVIISGGTCAISDTTPNVALIVNGISAATVAGQTVCSGTNATFSVSVTNSGPGTLTYQWKRSTDGGTTFSNITGATSASYIVTAPTASSDNYRYQSIVTSASCTAFTSTSGTLRVNGVTAATVASQTVCSGVDATFTVSVTNSGSAVLTYQWKRSTDGGSTFANITGATGATYIVSAAPASSDNYQYEAAVTSGSCTVYTSTVATLRVNAVTSATVASQAVCSGTDATFTLSATNTGPGSLTYQWKRSTDGGSTFSNIAGATGTKYIVTAPTYSSDNYQFENIVTSGSCTSVVSTAGTLRVNVVTAATVAGQTVCSGVNAVFTVIPTNYGSASLTYQWKISTNGGSTFSNITGANASTYTVSAPASTFDNYQYQSVVTSGSCAAYTSNAAILRVNAVTSATVVAQTVCAGNDATFTVTTTNTGSAALSYQWKRSTDGGTTYNNISGANAATYVVSAPGISSDKFKYESLVSSGSCSAYTSNAVDLRINTAPAISGGPVSKTVCERTSVSFSVTANDTALTYQWRRGTINLSNSLSISGATTATLTIFPVSTTDADNNYNVVISGTCSPDAISNNVSLNVNTSPDITSNATTETACAGSPATFSVTATGTALTYQWRRGNAILTNTGSFSGVTSANFTINDVTTADAGSDYNVVISGTCFPNDTSNNFSLIVNTAPDITSVPANQITCEGNAVSFSVSANGTALTYQWRKGNVNIANSGSYSGANSAILTINPATTSDAGNNYNVVISGTCAPVFVSKNVSLTVNTSPAIISGPVSQTVCEGNTASFSVSATGTDLTYQWRDGNVNLTDGGSILGSNTNVLTISPAYVSKSSTHYNVVITGVCAPAIISNDVSLIVNAAVSIINSPEDITACENTAASFTVNATGAGLRYQWRKGNTNLVNGGTVSGVNTAVLTFNPVNVSDIASDYNVVVSGTCSTDFTSNDVSLTVNTAPKITAGPNDASVCDSSAISFWVTTTGLGVTYQWRKGNVDLVNGGNISGANSDILTINPVSNADRAADYNVVVMGTCAPNDTSKNVSLYLCGDNGISPYEAGNINNAVAIYPNPFTSSINIVVKDVMQTGKLEIKIFNAMGTEVLSTIMTKELNTIDASNLSPGIYFYNVIDQNKVVQSGKLVSIR